MRAQAEAAVLARLPLRSEAGGAHAAAPDLAAAASAADQAGAAAALLAVSGDGRWAAVASRQIVHLVDLARLQSHGVLPPLQARHTARASLSIRKISFGSAPCSVRHGGGCFLAGVLMAAHAGSNSHSFNYLSPRSKLDCVCLNMLQVSRDHQVCYVHVCVRRRVCL